MDEWTNEQGMNDQLKSEGDRNLPVRVVYPIYDWHFDPRWPYWVPEEEPPETTTTTTTTVLPTTTQPPLDACCDAKYISLLQYAVGFEQLVTALFAGIVIGWLISIFFSWFRKCCCCRCCREIPVAGAQDNENHQDQDQESSSDENGGRSSSSSSATLQPRIFSRDNTFPFSVNRLPNYNPSLSPSTPTAPHVPGEPANPEPQTNNTRGHPDGQIQREMLSKIGMPMKTYPRILVQAAGNGRQSVLREGSVTISSPGEMYSSLRKSMNN